MRRHATTWIMHCGILIGLGVTAMVLWQRAAIAQDDLARRRQEVEGGPVQLLRASTLASELEHRRADIKRLAKYLVSQDELGIVVASLEREAQAWRVDVSVPTVREKVSINEQGVVVPTEGPFLDAEFAVTAKGHPNDLVGFLHALEHLPYLLRLESWVIKSVAVPRPPDQEEDAKSSGQLEARFVMKAYMQDLGL